jgi:hypothetical protein
MAALHMSAMLLGILNRPQRRMIMPDNRKIQTVKQRIKRVRGNRWLARIT